ncbi:hypothetical protein [Desulfosporosinus hippei]|uniref:Uncharacterized protein n=1 Tax=Desulfosporosinus hippei DSM 8344 TaxID=1121419 RepID=A0A1G7XWI1_9FIRM|nr:hypothetical protein [Desulfosporosinus hippei]SDG88565.1 hypothetical protein SAMN05443529_107127 [Desulfosporosinus hippei DSM 8344]
MTKLNKLSDHGNVNSSKHTSKTSPEPNTTGKSKEDVIFTKDKSPDDLEILD